VTSAARLPIKNGKRAAILGDPGAASLFEGQKSPWELTLTEPVPEICEFVPLIGQKNHFSGQSVKRCSRGTLSLS